MKSAVAILALVMGLATGLSADRPDLSGRVTNDEGKPVPNATVFIYTAGPKVGIGVTCPSCYADCRKKARTDTQGQYKIEALDPKLVFRLLVVGRGLQPKFVPKVNPAAGPRDIEVSALEDEPGRVKTQGLVMDPDGQPLFGAVLSVEGVDQGPGSSWGGVERFADPVSVTDERGLFTLFCSKDVAAVHALLETSGFAKRWVRLTPGEDHLLRVQNGVVVRGELVDNAGQPVQNAIVAMATIVREAGKHLHDFEAVTAADGHFSILNVTPENTYYLFGKMESLGHAGALNVRSVKAGATDTTVDLGKVALVPSHTIKGRVVLSDGGEIPSNSRLFLGRDGAWDHTETLIGSSGEFEFRGVPAEAVSLSLNIRGYKWSHKNPSLDWLNGGIIGRVEGDLNDFVILLERGAWRYNEERNDAPPNTNEQPRDLPLRSAKL